MGGAGPCRNLKDKRIRWIVPFSPGGGFDVYSRLIVPFLSGRIGAKIAVENVPGAGGILGAQRIKEAAPNGRTLGIINAPGLLTACLTGLTQSPNPIRDFTILGRVTRSKTVWITGNKSGFHSMEDVFRISRHRPVLFGITEAGSTNFSVVAVTSHILRFPVDYIAGFPGTRQSTLALIRGEVDLVSVTFESALDRIESGDLKVLLQIGDTPIADHAVLKETPCLGGATGLAALRAIAMGRQPREDTIAVEALVNLVESGRLVVAPRGIPADEFECLESGLYAALTDPVFQSKAAMARRSLDLARATEAKAAISKALERADAFAPIIQKAILKMRL
jgi:tripartite-type tricarboxylate transporter receptor subunit TctC